MRRCGDRTVSFRERKTSIHQTAQPGATDNLGYAQRIREGSSFRSSEARCLSFIVSQKMKSGIRTVLRFLPIALQFAAMAAAIGLIAFITPVTQRIVQEAEGEFAVPSPTRLLVENAGAGKAMFVALFLVSVLTMILTRTKMKEEADRILVQSAVFSGVWYLGITLLGGIVMAALLPHFAMAAGAQ